MKQTKRRILAKQIVAYVENATHQHTPEDERFDVVEEMIKSYTQHGISK